MPSTPSVSASPARPAENVPNSRQSRRKRRKLNAEKESIYLVPEIKPYALFIKQRNEVGPSWATAATESEPPLDLEPVNPPKSRPRSIQSTSRPASREGTHDSGVVPGEDGDSVKKSYRARALRAWETKRQRQTERFEALEAGLAYVPGRSRATSLHDGEDGSPAGLDPLLSLDLDQIPEDLPKDDLLQSIHAYAAKYYTDRGLLLPLTGQSRPRSNIRRTSRLNTPLAPATPSPPTATAPTPSIDVLPNAESGSEKENSPDPLTLPLGHIPGIDDTASEYDELDSSANESEEDEGDGEMVEEPQARKRGGQPGKRKLKDMYLSIDGSGLLAFGVMLQEQIIAHLRREGYVPRSSLVMEQEDEDQDGEQEALETGIGRTFEVSDDESEITDGEGYESEEAGL